MTSEESFLRAIEESPDDPAHALVYADWLADQGEDDRAEFVRLGCALAKLDPLWDVEHPLLAARRDRLHNKHREDWQRWNGDFHFHGCTRMPRHGVPSAVRIFQMEEFLEQTRAALAPPLLALSVRLEPEDDGRFFRMRRLAHLRELFVETIRKDAAAALIRSPYLGQLRKLTVKWPCLDWGRQEDLFRAPLLEHLTELTIARISFEENYLFARPRPADLRRLWVKETALTTSETERLFSADWAGLTELHFDEVEQLGFLRDHVGSKHLGSLQALTVRDNEYFGCDGATTIFRNEALVNLRTLRLPKLHNRGDAGDFRDALARLDLPALRYLDLGENSLSSFEIEALGRSPTAPRLVGLKLGGTGLTNVGAAALARGDFRSLRRLELHSIDLGVSGLKALLAAPWMPNVAWLDLSNNGLQRSAARALGQSARVSGLRVLNLSGNDLGDKGVAQVVGSDHLAQLQALYLNETKLTDAAMPALAGAPMLRNLAVLMLEHNEGLSREAPLALSRSGRLRNLQQIRWDWGGTYLESLYFDEDGQARVNDAFGAGCYNFQEDEASLDDYDPRTW